MGKNIIHNHGNKVNTNRLMKPNSLGYLLKKKKKKEKKLPKYEIFYIQLKIFSINDHVNITKRKGKLNTVYQPFFVGR